MPRGDKDKYTDKQKRKAEHIEVEYENHGVDEKEAERRAWATVNKSEHGGKKPGGSGYGKIENHLSETKGGTKSTKKIVSKSSPKKTGTKKSTKSTTKKSASSHVASKSKPGVSTNKSSSKSRAVKKKASPRKASKK